VSFLPTFHSSKTRRFLRTICTEKLMSDDGRQWRPEQWTRAFQRVRMVDWCILFRLMCGVTNGSCIWVRISMHRGNAIVVVFCMINCLWLVRRKAYQESCRKNLGQLLPVEKIPRIPVELVSFFDEYHFLHPSAGVTTDRRHFLRAGHCTFDSFFFNIHSTVTYTYIK